MASAFRESSDQVHGHLGEWGVVIRYRDFVQGGLRFVCEIFVLLTDRAPLYVLLDPGSSSWPTEAVEDLPGGFVSAQVSHQPIVVGMHDASSGSFVRWDDRLLVSVEPQASIIYPSLRFLLGIEPGLILPSGLR